MGLTLVFVGLLVIACGGLVWLGLRHRALTRRFANVIAEDVELARLRAEQSATVAATAELHRSANAKHATDLAERERAATDHVKRELERLTAAVRVANDTRTRLDSETTSRRETSEREYAAATTAMAARLRDLETQGQARLAKLQADYESGHAIYARLKRELALLEDQSEDISFGLYKPSYSFDTPEQYKAALDKVWTEQKTLVRMDGATVCPREWSVGGSLAEGRRMQKQLAKLMLRAFNGEVEGCYGAPLLMGIKAA